MRTNTIGTSYNLPDRGRELRTDTYAIRVVDDTPNTIDSGTMTRKERRRCWALTISILAVNVGIGVWYVCVVTS